MTRGPFSAALAGAAVGILGGLLGLGGAEFRLPVLVALCAFTLRRAIPIAPGIGALLIIEAVTPWESRGLPLGAVGRRVVSTVAGLAIGTVPTLLGVAGGEPIIPTFVLAFGVPIKAAGTPSLLISRPTMLVGLCPASGARHAKDHPLRHRRSLTCRRCGARSGSSRG